MCSKTPSKEAIDNYIGLLFADKPQCPMVDEETLAQISPASAAAAGGPSYCIPHIVFMVGPPGAGKSTARSECIAQLRKNERDFVVISSDDIIVNLFDSDNECRDKVNPIIDTITEYGRGGRYNLVYETLGFEPDWVRSLAKQFSNASYTTVLCVIDIEKESAIKRMKKREVRTGQPTPPRDYIDGKYAEKNSVYMRYLSYDKRDSQEDDPVFDVLYIFDNNSDTMELILARFNEEYRCWKPDIIKKRFPEIYCRVCGSSRMGMGGRRYRSKSRRIRRQHRRSHTTRKLSRRHPHRNQNKQSRRSRKY